MYLRQTTANLAAALGFVVLSAAQVQAIAPIVNAVGFEAPAFVLGDLSGQQGWTDDGLRPSTAVIQDDFVLSGTQAVQVDRAASSDQRWAIPVVGFPTGRFVTVSWDMAVTITPKEDGVFGPFFGVEANDEIGNPIALLGSLGVDSTTGDVLIQEAGTGYLVATTVVSDEWNHFEIELDFLDKSYRTYFNGSILDTVGFVDGSVGGDDFFDASIVTFAAAGNSGSQEATGTAWFDNFLVIDGIAGDYNGDSMVDAADYTVWRDHLGQTGESLAADGNGDGVVDAIDYEVWSDHFGRGGPIAGALAAAPLAVPEPAAAAMLILALGAGGCLGVFRSRVRN